MLIHREKKLSPRFKTVYSDVDNGIDERAIAEEKHALRGVMRRRLAGVDAAFRRSSAETLAARLACLPAWQNARQVLLFAPMPAEPDVDNLWDGGQLGGKQCAYPAVSGNELRLYRVDRLADLRPVPPWNLREPAPDASRVVSVGEIDLLLIPGLAFDVRGGRLGRGGGYYDRLLATRAGGGAVAIGVCFEFQRVNRLPLAPHDALVDGIIVC